MTIISQLLKEKQLEEEKNTLFENEKLKQQILKREQKKREKKRLEAFALEELKKEGKIASQVNANDRRRMAIPQEVKDHV